MIKGKDIHVISSEGRWIIMQEGANNFIHIAETVGAAVCKAREAARMSNSAIIVHKGHHY